MKKWKEFELSLIFHDLRLQIEKMGGNFDLFMIMSLIIPFVFSYVNYPATGTFIHYFITKFIDISKLAVGELSSQIKHFFFFCQELPSFNTDAQILDHEFAIYFFSYHFPLLCTCINWMSLPYPENIIYMISIYYSKDIIYIIVLFYFVSISHITLISCPISIIHVAGCTSAGAKLSGDGGGSCRASCVRCCVLGRVFGFNHKIIINV